MKLDRKAYENIDWEKLYKRLFVCSKKLVGGANILIDCGVSAEDLVIETLLEFFESEDGLKWKKDKGRLDSFLCKVLKNNFIDHIRRNKKVLGSLDDEYFQTTFPDTNHIVDTQKEAESNLFVYYLSKTLKDEKVLEELITAALLTTNDGKINQQMAELLETTTADIVNRKKQLLRKTNIRELL